MRFTAVLPAVILAMALSFPSFVLAGDTEQAGKLFKQGNKLREAEKYSEALDKYNAAYKLLPSFKIEYNTALVLEKMGNHPAAYMVYKSFLKSGAGKSPRRVLDRAENKLESLKRKIAILRVSCNLARASVEINGVDFGTTPLPEEVPLKPGEAVVKVHSPGHIPHESRLRLSAGSAAEVKASLKPIPAAPAAQPPPSPAPEDQHGGEAEQNDSTAAAPHSASSEQNSEATYLRIKSRESKTKTTWAWTTLGVGLACAAGAGVMYGVGFSQRSAAYDEYSDTNKNASSEELNDKWSEVEAGHRLTIGGHVLAGAAAVAVGVSVYMFLTRPAEETGSSAAASGLRLGVAADGRSVGLLARGGF